MSAPDISLIIRYSRPHTVGRAIDSVLAQAWSNTPASLEILVIDTLGTNTPCTALAQRGLTSTTEACPTRLPTMVLRWTSEHRALSRAQALACGIGQARGRFTLFLDDDDRLAVQHIEKLYRGFLSNKTHNPNVVAVTTGVQLIPETANQDTPKPLQIWDSPLARERLILANQLPFMAFMAETATLRACTVDQQLEIYEDWDLLIQFAQRGRFVHLPGVTADYFLNPSGSGVHDHGKAEQAAKTIRKKWVDAFQREDFEKLNQCLLDADHLAEKLNQCLLDADHLARENSRLLEKLSKAEDQLHAVVNSRSWRLTAPFRGLMTWWRGRSHRGN